MIPHGGATLVFSYNKSAFYGKLFGSITKLCMVGSLANKCDMLLIIEFQPAGLYGFTGINQKEIVNQIIPFEMINSTLNKRILETLENTDCLNELIGCLDKYLLENLYTLYPPELQMATKMIIKNYSNISCRDISAFVYYSERHLNRIFENYLGMNIKTFLRMVRINKAIRFMQNSQYSITNVSYETGFYDLSHFIHDFKSVCEITPQEYRNNMSNFYNEIAKF